MTSLPSRLALTSTGGRRVEATGVVDAHTTDDLLSRLREFGTEGDVSLDLGGIEFIDSSGIRTLIVVHQDLEAAGHRLVLAAVSEAVGRLIEIAGLHDQLHRE